MDAADLPLTIGAACYPNEIEYTDYLKKAKPLPVVCALHFE